MAHTSPVPRLIVIPISHYCEKARWALDRAGIPYEVQGTAQVLHRFALRKVGAGRTTPVLVMPDGSVIEGSDQIVRYADEVVRGTSDLGTITDTDGSPRAIVHPLRPSDGPQRAAIDRWVEHFDRELGPVVRRWAYHDIMLSLPTVMRHGLHQLPISHRAFVVLGWPVLKPAMRHHMKATPEESAAAEVSIARIFDAVAQTLEGSTSKRSFLVGDRFSAADLAFAALAAATVRPPNYGYPIPGPLALTARVAAKVNAFREHPAGQFALRLYQHER